MPNLQDTLLRLAGSFVAHDIMTCEADLEKAEDFTEAKQKLELRPKYDVIPIRKSNRLVAFAERGKPRQKVIQIQDVVGANTPILDLVESLADRRFTFVLGRHKVIGLITISDLNDPIVKLPYFVLLEGLERRVSDMVRPLITDNSLEAVISDPARLDFLLKKKQKMEDAFRDWPSLLYFNEILQAGVHFKQLNLPPKQIEDLVRVRNKVSHATGDEMVEKQADVCRLDSVRKLCRELLAQEQMAEGKE